MPEVTTAAPSKSSKTQEGAPPPSTNPAPPVTDVYWRNVSDLDQLVLGPDNASRTVPSGCLVHEDQFVDPTILRKQPNNFVCVRDKENATAKAEKENRKLVVGGKYNTAKGQYVPRAAG